MQPFKPEASVQVAFCTTLAGTGATRGPPPQCTPFLQQGRGMTDDTAGWPQRTRGGCAQLVMRVILTEGTPVGLGGLGGGGGRYPPPGGGGGGYDSTGPAPE